MDEGVGRILEAIHRRRLERDTLVFFTSDNGGERFSHMGPFSEGKMTLREGGIRVAAVVRWPGLIRTGSRCEQVCSTFDISATTASLASARADSAAPFDGIDLMPALRGGAPRPRDLYWRLTQRRQQKALRSGGPRRWRAIVFDRPEEPVRIELLDLAGNVVSEASPTANGVRIDTTNVAPGRYLVRVSRDSGIERTARAVDLRLLPPR